MAFFPEKPNPFFLEDLFPPNGVTFPTIIILEMRNVQTFVVPTDVCGVFSLLENDTADSRMFRQVCNVFGVLT